MEGKVEEVCDGMMTFNLLLHNSAFSHLWKYHEFENIMENGEFALLEQLLNFP